MALIHSSGNAHPGRKPEVAPAWVKCRDCEEWVNVANVRNNRCEDCQPLGGRRLVGGASKTPQIRRQAAVKQRK